MLLRCLITFAVPLAASLLITPWIIRLAVVVGATDQPNERKIHQHPMPRIGGVAVYLSFLFSLLVFVGLNPLLHHFDLIVPRKGVMLIASILNVLGLGLWDDLKTLSPKQKFLVQIVAASLAYAAGFRVLSVSHPGAPDAFLLGSLAYPATVLWIVGITNAFNLIDGLDGLSAGTAVIALLTMASISYLSADFSTTFLALSLAGAITGFLKYNFNPARIFLGDSGSLFIGFTLAVLSIQSSTKGSVTVSLLVPILALGLPIMDTLLSMIRRLLRSFIPSAENAHPESFAARLHGMFLPDKAHIHHKLLAQGVKHRNVVLMLYLVSCVFGAGAFALSVVNNTNVSIILIAVALATYAGIRQLHYKEMAILKNGVLLPLYTSPFFRRSLFQGLLDLGFIAIAYSIAYYLATAGQSGGQYQFLVTLSVVSVIQIVSFLGSGLYKRTFEHLGLGDTLKIIKSVVIAAFFTWMYLAVRPHEWSMSNTVLIMADFYLLFTLVAGVRLSYQALNFIFRRETGKGRNVLIYGATSNGILTLQQLLLDESLNLHPVGFLDDNPQLEGMRVNDYPVFGGHWKLQSLLEKYSIDEILLATDSVKPAVFRRLKQIARRKGIHIKQAKLMFEDIPLPQESEQNPQPEQRPEPKEITDLIHPEGLPGMELSKP